MPRKHRPRTTTLYLPPPDQAAGPAPGADAQAPSLDVLLMAQQIAHSRGHAFDIESFLAPSQRDEYIAIVSGEATPAEGSEDSDTPAEGEGSEAGAESPMPDGSPRPSKRARTSSSLAQMYWRQRIDRGLAGKDWRSGSRGSTPRPSVKPDPDAPSPAAAPSTPMREPKAKDVITAADRTDIQASASYWNHLLVQARAARGPQWDYNTQMLQVDQHSETYYSHGLPPPPTPPKPEKKKLPDVEPEAGPSMPNGKVSNEATPGPGAKANGDAKEKSDKDKGAKVDGKGKEKEKAPTPVPAPAHAPSPARPPSSAGQPPAQPPTPTAQTQQSPASGGGTPGRQLPGVGQYPSSPAGSGPSPSQSQNQLPPHLRMQQAAQANVQAQALALGQSGGFNLNPAMLQLQQQGQRGGPGGQGGQGGQGGPGGPGGPGGSGINPMALMGGMGGMQMGQMGGMGQQFMQQGGQGQGGQGGQGPMLAGWGGDQFQQSG